MTPPGQHRAAVGADLDAGLRILGQIQSCSRAATTLQAGRVFSARSGTRRRASGACGVAAGDARGLAALATAGPPAGCTDGAPAPPAPPARSRGVGTSSASLVRSASSASSSSGRRPRRRRARRRGAGRDVALTGRRPAASRADRHRRALAQRAVPARAPSATRGAAWPRRSTSTHRSSRPTNSASAKSRSASAAEQVGARRTSSDATGSTRDERRVDRAHQHLVQRPVHHRRVGVAAHGAERAPGCPSPCRTRRRCRTARTRGWSGTRRPSPGSPRIPVIAYTPTVMMMSWITATIAASAMRHSKRNVRYSAITMKNTTSACERLAADLVAPGGPDVVHAAPARSPMSAVLRQRVA